MRGDCSHLRPKLHSWPRHLWAQQFNRFTNNSSFNWHRGCRFGEAKNPGPTNPTPQRGGASANFRRATAPRPEVGLVNRSTQTHWYDTQESTIRTDPRSVDDEIRTTRGPSWHERQHMQHRRQPEEGKARSIQGANEQSQGQPARQAGRQSSQTKGTSRHARQHVQERQQHEEGKARNSQGASKQSKGQPARQAGRQPKGTSWHERQQVQESNSKRK